MDKNSKNLIVLLTAVALVFGSAFFYSLVIQKKFQDSLDYYTQINNTTPDQLAGQI